MKRFLALGLTLTAVLFSYPVAAQITVEEKAFFIPETKKFEVSECDFVKMVVSLSFKIVEREANGKYYDLVSEKNRDDRYQRFAVELKNCRIEQAEKNEWASNGFSIISYKFLLAGFVADIDSGMTPDGFNKVLRVLVKVYLEPSYYMSLEEQKFFDTLLGTLKLVAIKGEMTYSVSGNGVDKIFPRSPGEIQELRISIRPR